MYVFLEPGNKDIRIKIATILQIQFIFKKVVIVFPITLLYCFNSTFTLRSQLLANLV